MAWLVETLLLRTDRSTRTADALRGDVGDMYPLVIQQFAAENDAFIDDL